MPLIETRTNHLHIEDVPCEEIAASAGTPVYAYSRGVIERRFAAWRKALGFAGERLLVCYAVKANGNQSVLRTLRNAGAGADLTTGGELQRALAAGFPPERIVFSGIGKRDEDLTRALTANIRQINAESTAELERIEAVAAQLGARARVALRLNPQLDSLSRPKQAQIITGKPDSKFGIPWPRVEAMLPDWATRFAHLDLAGFSLHIGSNFQDADFDQYEITLAQVRDVYLPAFIRHGHTPQAIDIGGGVGVNDRDPFQADNPLIARFGTIAERILGPTLNDLPRMTLIVEPGRSLVAEAGVLLTRVVNVKDESGGAPRGLDARFVIVDAAMNDLIRPSLYGAFHLIVPVQEPQVPDDQWWENTDICGTVCETTDSFMRPLPMALGWPLVREGLTPEAIMAEIARLPEGEVRDDIRYGERPPAWMLREGDDGQRTARFGYFLRRRFPPVKAGDLLAITMAGAYGAVLGSQFNARPLPAEVLVDGARHAIVRPRRTVEEIIAGEPVPAWLDGPEVSQ